MDPNSRTENDDRYTYLGYQVNEFTLLNEKQINEFNDLNETQLL